MRHPVPPRQLIAALLVVASAATAAPAGVAAQEARSPAPWRVSAEAGAALGGLWLEGPAAPRVSSGVGFMFAAGLHRGVTANTNVAGALRVSLQPIDLRENGTRWSGGTLAEYDLLGLLSFRMPSPTSLDAALEFGAGAAVLTGARDVVPFSGSTGIAPMGEAGVVVTLLGASSGRREVALVGRYGAVRASAENANAGTSGWVGRASVGVRVTR